MEKKKEKKKEKDNLAKKLRKIKQEKRGEIVRKQ